MSARVLSVNVGLPREVEWRGRRVTTAIFKEPVEGRVRLHTLNLAGDKQAESMLGIVTGKLLHAHGPVRAAARP